VWLVKFGTSSIFRCSAGSRRASSSISRQVVAVPLELAKHGDCPSKNDASIDGNFARLASVDQCEITRMGGGLTGESLSASAFFGHRSDPGLPKYALKGDHEKKSHAMNVDWEIA
jgi:hypothetical protein